MTRSTLILSAAIVVLAAFLASSILTRPAPGLNADEVRAMIGAELAETSTERAMQTSSADAATIHPMIESYLLANPQILEEMGTKLTAMRRAEEAEQARTALAELHVAIYEDEDHVVIGNPDGDVTLVELFDYNCGYCRTAVPDMATLLAEDPDLRIILKEFPILSQGSVEAARVAIAASQAGIDYWDFHSTLFSSRGQIDGQAALDAAEAQGLNPVTLALDAQNEDINAVIQRSYDIAQGLNVSGTPTYILGDEVIQGAVGLDALRTRIANMRACGATSCDG